MLREEPSSISCQSRPPPGRGGVQPSGLFDPFTPCSPSMPRTGLKFPQFLVLTVLSICLSSGWRATAEEAPTQAVAAQEAPQQPPPGQPAAKPEPLFNDIHFHLTNYVHEGITTRRMLSLMEQQVGRVALFGIPLSQKWDFFLNGKRRPGYYLESSGEMYYYSFIDAMIARQYQKLAPADRERFDPFIVGFNPTDMNAPDHIRHVLATFPGVFVGIGEFSIHKELVSSKIAGHAASVRNPAIGEILRFAGDVGLLVMLHCDINEVRGVGNHPAHADDLRELFGRHPETSIIYAHTGLGRFVGPTSTHIDLLREFCEDPGLNHVHFDLSWDEVAKWVVKDEETIKSWVALITRHQTRFLFGSDSVAPRSQDAYLKTYRDYQPLWDRLPPEVSRAVRLQNYERLVNAARKKVRARERANLAEDEDIEEPDVLPFPEEAPVQKAAGGTAPPAEKRAG